MHLYKDKTKSDDWKCFKNYLLANKVYLLKFVSIKLTFLSLIKHILAFLGISKGLQNILYSLSYPLAYLLHHLFIQK